MAPPLVSSPFTVHLAITYMNMRHLGDFVEKGGLAEGENGPQDGRKE